MDQSKLNWWEEERVNYAISYLSVRLKLQYLLGNNIVSLSCWDYMRKLSSILNDDYQRQQLARIEEKKKMELMRIKCILNRLMSARNAPAELRNYPLLQLYVYCDAIIKDRQMKKKFDKKNIKLMQKLYKLLYSTEMDGKEEKIQDDNVLMKKITIEGKDKLVPITSDESIEVKRQLDFKKEIAAGYMLTPEDFMKAQLMEKELL